MPKKNAVLYKSFLEGFYDFFLTTPGLAGTPPDELMSEVLTLEARRRAIYIITNSFGTELSKQNGKKLY